MKLHYKLIISLDPPEEYNNVLEDKTEYCCAAMESARLDLAVLFSGDGVHLQGSDFGGGTIDFSPAISFCPFCGNVVEMVEDVRVRRIKREMLVPTIKYAEEVIDKEDHT